MNEFEALLKNRENMYRLLGRLYLKETDTDLFKTLQGLQFPAVTDDGPEGDAATDKMAEGYSRLAKFLANPPEDVETELAADYARVFLGAGTVDDIVANPHESVYTSAEKLVCQDAFENMVKTLKGAGLKKDDNGIFEDHIGLEFAYMQHMCARTLDAARKNDEKRVDTLLGMQSDFIDEHLLNWVPRFCEDIRKIPCTDFYPAVSLITEGFISQEKSMFSEE